MNVSWYASDAIGRKSGWMFAVLWERLTVTGLSLFVCVPVWRGHRGHRGLRGLRKDKGYCESQHQEILSESKSQKSGPNSWNGLPNLKLLWFSLNFYTFPQRTFHFYNIFLVWKIAVKSVKGPWDCVLVLTFASPLCSIMSNKMYFTNEIVSFCKSLRLSEILKTNMQDIYLRKPFFLFAMIIMFLISSKNKEE